MNNQDAIIMEKVTPRELEAIRKENKTMTLKECLIHFNLIVIINDSITIRMAGKKIKMFRNDYYAMDYDLNVLEWLGLTKKLGTALAALLK